MSTLTKAPLELPEGLIRAVHAAYAHPPRAYHSFAHVQEVLRHFDAVGAGPGWRHPREVFLACLFHDAVYQAGHKDNEAKSAALARAAVETWLPRAGLDVARVEHLIRLTARHGSLAPGDVDPEEALFLDCDMAILGAEPAAFDAYHRGVEEEYRGHVPAVLYRLGRSRFLTGLLAKHRLFLSDFFHVRYDAAARANLQRAVDAA
ncbi:MAG: hypothetical protein HY906_23735 [Deltaproteobacteria bacterium]|nr:hypothetical protein [Deltaproteobacteria bacterium]